MESKDYAEAESLLTRAIAADPHPGLVWSNLVSSRIEQGKIGEAEAALAEMRDRLGANLRVDQASVSPAVARRDYEGAERLAAEIRAQGRGLDHPEVDELLARLAMIRGKLTDAERYLEAALLARRKNGELPWYVTDVWELAFLDVLIRRDGAAGVRRLKAALDGVPPDSIPPSMPAAQMQAAVYAHAGDAVAARRVLAESEAVGASEDEVLELWSHWALGVAALVEGQPREALGELEIWRTGIEDDCRTCGLPDIGRAYEMAGQPDSALAAYERFIATPWVEGLDWDALFLAHVYERLARLYEERGDRERAIDLHNALIELWRDADPELQPRVEAARQAIERLSPAR
jgi:tetratricopeptide (TPR) repeat protein